MNKELIVSKGLSLKSPRNRLFCYFVLHSFFFLRDIVFFLMTRLQNCHIWESSKYCVETFVQKVFRLADIFYNEISVSLTTRLRHIDVNFTFFVWLMKFLTSMCILFLTKLFVFTETWNLRLLLDESKYHCPKYDHDPGC